MVYSQQNYYTQCKATFEGVFIWWLVLLGSDERFKQTSQISKDGGWGVGGGGWVGGGHMKKKKMAKCRYNKLMHHYKNNHTEHTSFVRNFPSA